MFHLGLDIMNGRFAKVVIILIAFIDALMINILPEGQAHDIAIRVMLVFVAMIPPLLVGHLLKSICCCKKS